MPVPRASVAPEVALSLIDDDGVRLIEVCGGFSLVDAARVADAVGGRVPVGHVTFAADAASGVARYSAAFESRA